MPGVKVSLSGLLAYSLRRGDRASALAIFALANISTPPCAFSKYLLRIAAEKEDVGQYLLDMDSTSALHIATRSLQTKIAPHLGDHFHAHAETASSNWQHALVLNWWCHQADPSHEGLQKLWGRVIRNCGDQKVLTGVLAHAIPCRSGVCVPLSEVIHALCATLPSWADVFRLCEGIRQSQHNLATVLHICGYYRAWEAAIHVFRRVFPALSRGTAEYSVLIAVLHTCGAWQQSLQTLWHMRTGPNTAMFPTASALNDFITRWGRTESWADALRVASRVLQGEDSAATPDVPTLRDVMATCASAGQWEEVLRVAATVSAPTIELVVEAIRNGARSSPVDIRARITLQLIQSLSKERQRIGMCEILDACRPTSWADTLVHLHVMAVMDHVGGVNPQTLDVALCAVLRVRPTPHRHSTETLLRMIRSSSTWVLSTDALRLVPLEDVPWARHIEDPAAVRVLLERAMALGLWQQCMDILTSAHRDVTVRHQPEVISLVCDNGKWELAACFIASSRVPSHPCSTVYARSLCANLHWHAAAFALVSSPVSLTEPAKLWCLLCLLRKGYGKAVARRMDKDTIAPLVRIAMQTSCITVCFDLHMELLSISDPLADMLLTHLVRAGHWEFALHTFSNLYLTSHRGASGPTICAVIDVLMENKNWARALHTYYVYEQTCLKSEESNSALVRVAHGLLKFGQVPPRGPVLNHLMATLREVPGEKAAYDALDRIIRNR